MKLYRNVIILSVVLVVIVGAFILVEKYAVKPDNNTTVDTKSENLSIFSYSKDDIAEVTIENKDVKYVLTKKGDEYTIAYPAGITPDSVIINTTFDNLASLNADKVFEENASNLSKFGLDKSSTVTLKLKDGTTKTLEIGSETPSKNSSYVKLKGENKIYVLSNYFVDTFKVNKVYFKQRDLFKPKKEDLTEISLERGENLIFTANRYSADKWVLSKPVSGNVNSDKMDAILTYFTSVSAMNYEDNVSQDLSVYGLDKPAYALEVKSKTGNIKLLIGKEKTKDEEIYAKLADGSDVFTLGVASLDFLDLPISDLMERFVYLPDINDVSEITVNMDGKTTDCVLQLDSGGNKDKDKFTVNGKDASGKDSNGDFYFRSYFKALISLMFDDVNANANPSGTPEVTIEYRLKKAPGTAKVELIPRNSDSYYAMLDGKYTGKILYKRDLDQAEGIRETYNKLTDSQNKK